jgi:hypothetical protein
MLYEIIQDKTFQKSGINPYIQQFKYYYIIHKIISDQTLHRGDYIGSKLNIDTLTALFGGKDSISSGIVKDLVDWGVIVKTKEYTFKKSSSRYSLTDTYKYDKLTTMLVDIIDAGFVKKLIDKEHEEVNRAVRQLHLNIKSLTINNLGLTYLNNKYNITTSQSLFLPIERVVATETVSNEVKTAFFDKKAPDFLLGGVEFDPVDLSLIQILIGDFNSSRPDEKSRVYNNLTNLKREFRQYINFNDKPIHMTDISNSQVLLSVVPIKKEFKIVAGKALVTFPDDLIFYQKLTESGKFYEFLFEKVGYEGDRAKFKKQFFSDVFFSKVSTWSTKIKDAFKESFPTVYTMINRLKAKNHADFAVSMQRLEASIIIDTAAKKMVKAGKCILTLHDAIITNNEEDLMLAEKLISDAMVKHDIVPHFKRESTIKGKNGAPPSIEYEEYDADLDTVTSVIEEKTYYFANYSVIASNLTDVIDIKLLRERLIAANNCEVVKFKGVVYDFNKCIDGNDMMIQLVA